MRKAHHDPPPLGSAVPRPTALYPLAPASPKVPEHLTYDEFWARYFFRAAGLAKGKATGAIPFPDVGKKLSRSNLPRFRSTAKDHNPKLIYHR